MFKSLFGNGEKPAPTTPLIYDSDPLVIADEADQISFAGKIKVEFSPSETDPNQGVAIVLDIESDGWQPKLNVDKKLVEPAPFGPSRFGRRGGLPGLA